MNLQSVNLSVLRLDVPPELRLAEVIIWGSRLALGRMAIHLIAPCTQFFHNGYLAVQFFSSGSICATDHIIAWGPTTVQRGPAK